MKTLFMWYLVTMGYNSSLTWSPPFQSFQECEQVRQFHEKISQHVNSKAYCIRVTPGASIN